MAFQLPKADHKAIFEKHRRDRAIKRKMGDENAPVDEDEAVPDQNVAPSTGGKPAPSDEPNIQAPEVVVREVAPKAEVDTDKSAKTDKIEHTSVAANPERAKQSIKAGKSSARSVITRKADPSPAPDADTVSLKIRIAFPQPGQSKAYDSLAAQIGQQQAVRMLLKRAFDDLRTRLRSEKSLPAASAYLPTKDRFVTNKIISASELAIAKSSLDPLGIMNPMMFNRTLAERALALFFQEENKTA